MLQGNSCARCYDEITLGATTSLHPGDRVRLAPNLAAHLMKKGHKCRKVNWLTRCGLVIRVSGPTDSVIVKWDDRTSTDYWPIRALKKLL